MGSLYPNIIFSRMLIKDSKSARNIFSTTCNFHVTIQSFCKNYSSYCMKHSNFLFKLLICFAMASLKTKQLYYIITHARSHAYHVLNQSPYLSLGMPINAMLIKTCIFMLYLTKFFENFHHFLLFTAKNKWEYKCPYEDCPSKKPVKNLRVHLRTVKHGDFPLWSALDASKEESTRRVMFK